MLFMLLAGASYACPEKNMSHAGETVEMTASGPGGTGACTDMDAAQPGLCHVHAHANNQSLDNTGLPQVQPFVAAGLTLQITPLEIVGLSGEIREATSLTRPTAPPLAIRNCCFRI